MNDKVLSLLGLCRKSGNLTFGFDACIESIAKKQSHLILITSDLSKRTLNKIYNAANKSVDLITINLSMEDIHTNLGKPSGIISINNIGFAEKIKKLLTN